MSPRGEGVFDTCCSKFPIIPSFRVSDRVAWVGDVAWGGAGSVEYILGGEHKSYIHITGSGTM